ncbi:hypothetical protein BT67DRAFT_392444 [Trichocladium antarcticum]|uniref:Zn(2)-C6 fungal-type domain-containing protein n=1 Tax=Trichocladium antarcticum TaxID=1450529 RepID=A0AAN6UC83_9PEZI|nr:hypothetical protein BT67DRAFT_392444 [Trichocladium antarcticum]
MDSGRSSVEPSSSPGSPSSSPSPPPGQPKKRTRASKPKKPACNRCTSAGRTCDRYDRAALQRYGPPDPARTAELAEGEFVRIYQQSEALQSMRQTEPDIEDTETENRFVARFRAATADGVAAHLCSVTAFWSRVGPSTSSQDKAVWHAVVALSAAFQLFQSPDDPVVAGFTRKSLDLFAIQHYNKSIERLQRHAGSSAPESARVTLVCCLAFISLETLRGNHAVAVTHLANGLRILQSLPDPTFACLADDSVFVWPPARYSLDMPDIIQLFARFEISACFFTHGIQPVISERGYRTRHFDGGSAEGRFTDVSHARLPGPLCLVTKHTSDQGSRATAVRMLAESLCRGDGHRQRNGGVFGRQSQFSAATGDGGGADPRDGGSGRAGCCCGSPEGELS